MTGTPSLLNRTDWSDLPKIVTAALAIGGSVSLLLSLRLHILCRFEG